jgi:uncharacterized Fe-S cluster-containing radical SAM superfamily protein
MEPFDPIKRAQEIEGLVMEGDARKYYRFRYQQRWWAPSVADASGCCLSCAYCWNASRNQALPGKYCRPSTVAEKLNNMSTEHGDHPRAYFMRTGGCEPVLGEKSMNHLIAVLDLLDCDRFLLETNGIMLGENPQFFEKLEQFKDMILVRVTAKAHSPERFERITGAKADFFDRPIRAIHEAGRRGFDCELAYMPDFCCGECLKKISGWGGRYDSERLKIYPKTMENLRARNVLDLRLDVKA